MGNRTVCSFNKQWTQYHVEEPHTATESNAAMDSFPQHDQHEKEVPGVRLQSSSPINNTKQESIAEKAVWRWQRRFGKFFMSTTNIFNSAAHPTNAFSLQMWHHLKGK